MFHIRPHRDFLQHGLDQTHCFILVPWPGPGPLGFYYCDCGNCKVLMGSGGVYVCCVFALVLINSSKLCFHLCFIEGHVGSVRDRFPYFQIFRGSPWPRITPRCGRPIERVGPNYTGQSQAARPGPENKFPRRPMEAIFGFSWKLDAWGAVHCLIWSHMKANQASSQSA